MGKNEYLVRQKCLVDAYRQAERDTYMQFMTDTLILTLNDPDVMGRDVFGNKRIRKIVEAWGKAVVKYHGALEKGDEADYVQEKLDQQLIRILGEEGFHPFDERYDWVKKQAY